MRITLALTSLFFIGAACADDVSDACLQSMQSVYKFYYHEILPKSDDENSNKLSTIEAQNMEKVIAQLKENCPQEVIAKMNHFLQAETKQG